MITNNRRTIFAILYHRLYVVFSHSSIDRKNALRIFFNGFVMINSDIKKCHGLELLFTVDRQQDEAALAKRSSTSRPMSMSCRSTKAIGISFFIYRANLREELSVTVDCRSGIPYSA